MTLSTEIQSNYKHIFANDPIIVQAVTTAADVPVNATLPQLVLRITANGHTHEIPQQFVPGDTLRTDISSALQAEYQLIDRQSEPTPNLTSHTYTAFSAKIEAYVRYLINGTEYNGTPSTVMDGIYVLRGGLSAYLRKHFAAAPSAAVQALAAKLTTKPAMVEVGGTRRILEVKNVGDTQLISSYNTSTHVVSTNATAITAQTTPSADIPLIETDDHRHQIVFRNSLGVLETFSVKNLQKKVLTVNAEKYPVLSTPSYSPTLNILTEAEPVADNVEMSTGYMPREWVEWFIREVLTATYVWMAFPFIDPKTGVTTFVYLPVHLEADEKTTITDETQPQIGDVKFVVNTAQVR